MKKENCLELYAGTGIDGICHRRIDRSFGGCA